MGLRLALLRWQSALAHCFGQLYHDLRFIF
jgi:hypothetical protein